MKIAVVGHRTYFENHYAEGAGRNPNILCMDVDEGDYGWLNIVANFRPELTIFYRPELYPAQFLSRVPGYKVAFLSEPVPNLVEGRMIASDESSLRLAVYKNMSWGSYDHRVYYDPSKAASIDQLGFPIDEFRELPINTDWFHPSGKPKLWDVTFVGKATPHRILKLDFLRSAPFRFLWIAHGMHSY